MHCSGWRCSRPLPALQPLWLPQAQALLLLLPLLPLLPLLLLWLPQDQALLLLRLWMMLVAP